MENANKNNGHKIAQAFYGLPMLEAEAKERPLATLKKGDSPSLLKKFRKLRKAKRLKHLEKGVANNG